MSAAGVKGLGLSAAVIVFALTGCVAATDSEQRVSPSPTSTKMGESAQPTSSATNEPSEDSAPTEPSQNSTWSDAELWAACTATGDGASSPQAFEPVEDGDYIFDVDHWDVVVMGTTTDNLGNTIEVMAACTIYGTPEAPRVEGPIHFT